MLATTVRGQELGADDKMMEKRLMPVLDSTQGRWGYMLRDRWRIPPRFNRAKDFHEGHAAVQVEEVWGIIDSTGRMVVEPSYAQITSMDQGSAVGFDFSRGEACVERLKGERRCFPYIDYWAIWQEEMLASTIPDKELIVRVLMMYADPLKREREVSFIESTYVEAINVRHRVIKRLLAR